MMAEAESEARDINKSRDMGRYILEQIKQEQSE